MIGPTLSRLWHAILSRRIARLLSKESDPLEKIHLQQEKQHHDERSTKR